MTDVGGIEQRESASSFRSSARPNGHESILKDWAQFVIDHGKAALALAAALLYGVVRVAVEAFYSQFRVSPEDLGITQARIIGRAGLFFVFFLAALVAVSGTATSVALWVQRLSKSESERPQRHDERSEAYRTASIALWAIAAGLAILPLLLCMVTPELTAFLLGYLGPKGAVETSYPRMATAVWCASLALVVFAALHTADPRWLRERARSGAWQGFSLLVFVPWLAVFFVLNHHVRAHEDVIAVIVVAWPALALILLGALVWRTKHPSHETHLGAAYVASSVCFYLLFEPFLLSLVAQKQLRKVFPGASTLFKLQPQSVAQRLQLLGTLAPVVAVMVVVLSGCAYLVLHWLDGVDHSPDPHSESPASAAFIVTLASVVALCLLLLANARGTVLAHRVMQGERLRSSEGMLLASAEPACIAGVAGLKNPGPWMVIGSTSDDLVLYGPLTDPPDQTAGLGRSVFSVPSSGAGIDYLGTDVATDPDPHIAQTKDCAAFAKTFVANTVNATAKS